MEIKNSILTKIAILVDGDNAQPKALKAILEEVTRYGKVTIRRIYGDWTSAGMSGWKDILNELSFNPIQKFSYTTGKNSTDGALIIDAMDILHDKTVDGFCIVSSDSDFTGLAKRIREEGIFVMGVGRKTTPTAFIKSCEVFTFVENLLSDAEKEPAVVAVVPEPGNSSPIKTISPKTASKTKTKTDTKPAAKSSTDKNKTTGTKSSIVPPNVIKLLNKAFDSVVNESEEAHISALGSALQRLDPSFDSRTYGYSSLSKFLKAVDIFTIKDNRNNGLNHPVLRRKK